MPVEFFKVFVEYYYTACFTDCGFVLSLLNNATGYVLEVNFNINYDNSFTSFPSPGRTVSKLCFLLIPKRDYRITDIKSKCNPCTCMQRRVQYYMNISAARCLSNVMQF